MRTTTDRGYGWDWQVFMSGKDGNGGLRAERPICEDQAINHPDQVRASEEGHHIIKVKHAPHLRLDPDNVRMLCDDCHNKRTAKGE